MLLYVVSVPERWEVDRIRQYVILVRNLVPLFKYLVFQGNKFIACILSPFPCNKTADTHQKHITKIVCSTIEGRPVSHFLVKHPHTIRELESGRDHQSPVFL